MATTAILLINIGTPDQPEVGAVRRYLSEFLNDPKVIDIPWILRKVLVNLIIIPFRAPKSTLLYKKLWKETGSPLLHYANVVKEKLQVLMNKDADVYFAMRYGNPGIAGTIQQMKEKGYAKIVILPLFPQYASSTSETAIQEVEATMQQMKYYPETKIIKQFYNHPAYLKAMCLQIAVNLSEPYDHIIFSYHGLPIRHIDKSHAGIKESNCICSSVMPPHGAFCYKATCYETTRLLVGQLGLEQGKYSISFQSRLSKKWLTPFTDQTIINLAGNGIRRILVVAPSFVADCLETTIEIGEEYAHLFKQNGGEQLTLAKSLNDSDEWIYALREIVTE